MIEDGAPAKTKDRREGHPAARAAWVVFGLVLVGLKVEALKSLLHHGPLTVCIIFGLGAIHAFYRGKPLSCAFSIAVIAAVEIRPHPVLAALGVGAAAFLALGAACFIVGGIANLLEGPDPGFGRGWL